MFVLNNSGGKNHSFTINMLKFVLYNVIIINVCMTNLRARVKVKQYPWGYSMRNTYIFSRIKRYFWVFAQAYGRVVITGITRFKILSTFGWNYVKIMTFPDLWLQNPDFS